MLRIALNTTMNGKRLKVGLNDHKDCYDQIDLHAKLEKWFRWILYSIYQKQKTSDVQS